MSTTDQEGKKKFRSRRNILWLLLLILILAVALIFIPLIVNRDEMQPPQELHGDKLLIGYFPGYDSKKQEKLRAGDYTGLTHLHYAFVDISEDLTLELRDPYTDLENFNFLWDLQEQKGIKLIFSIGGKQNKSRFAEAASNSETRKKFAENCVAFVYGYGFDGLDLDWELPQGKEEKSDYRKLLRALREEIDNQQRVTGKQLSLSSTLPPEAYYLQNIKLKTCSECVDYFVFMGYDLHGSWDDQTDYNAPLYGELSITRNTSVGIGSLLKMCLAEQVPPQKLVLAVPFYGTVYDLQDESFDGLYQPFESVTTKSYQEIKEKYLSNPDYEYQYDLVTRVPYVTDGKRFVSFENPESIKEKVQMADFLNLGGIGIWELSQDCNGELLDSIRRALYQ